MKKSAALLCALLSACSLWPWGGDSERRIGPPSDATVYKCEGDRQLIVRYVGGKSAMVVLPEREFRLDQAASDAGTVYSNGRTTLITQGNETRLEEGDKPLLAHCIPGAAK
jgi:membrane-bound inhibitor of C-type lysozyme